MVNVTTVSRMRGSTIFEFSPRVSTRVVESAFSTRTRGHRVVSSDKIVAVPRSLPSRGPPRT